jgi:threonine dehydrogenase-like Zn-dependent dehydrogenase
VKAIVYTGPRELRYTDVAEPAPGPGEVVVEVRAVGVCGSELEGVASGSPFRVPPLIMGHEFAGRRADTGDRVVVNPLVACLECDLCLRGQANVCRRRAIVGIQRPGAYAERVAVPERCCYPAPAALDWETLALVEPLANALHAWRLPADRHPQRVGVIGAGPIGLSCVLVACSRGAPAVHVADLAKERRAAAERLGASWAGAALEGEFDLVVDAVGSPATRRAAVELTRPGGSAVWLGLHGPDPGFDGLALIRGEKSVLASFCYTDQDFRAAIGLAAAIDPWWVTSRPLSEGAELFMELMGGRTDLLKVEFIP